MPLTGEEIRRRLAELAARWAGYDGSERAEAQTFLTQLLDCYGVDRSAVGARFEEPTGRGFVDMIWPGVCLFEMKRPSEADRLAEHREQALSYWQRSGTPQQSAPRYVVLCAFHRFEIWEPGAVYTEPRAVVELADLPDQLETLLFLAERDPSFIATQAEVTRDAAVLLTDLVQELRERGAAELDVLRDFLLQCVWSMFAEDLRMLPERLFTRVVDQLIEDPRRSSADDLGQLFRYLAEPGPRPQAGVYSGTPYANGALFEHPAHVHLTPDDLRVLRRASAEFDWRRVEPAIFGNLLEGALGRERVWRAGAHYTSEAQILEVVLPTIVEPWRERIDSCTTLRDVQAAQRDLMDYVVLDPACGSGNFLYVAYRHLRRIEAELRRRESDMRRAAGLSDQGALSLFFPITNMRGIEIEPFAVKLARVTLWMGHKLAVDELDLPESVLPLADLSGIKRADALRVQWPPADVVIGNPPYHGSQRIRSELGDQYAEWLRDEFGVGLKDFAVYWFRRAHPALPDGGRAGLVVTNSISQNRNRGPTLEWIAGEGGVITHAVSTQDWAGTAAVDVSIVNWVKNPASPPERFVLDGEEVEGITPALRPLGLDVSAAARLAANRGKAFQGPIPAGEGFVLTPEEARALLARDDADYSRVVRPYLVGQDIAEDPAHAPRRWIIDFATMSLEQARDWPAAIEIVERRVRPQRAANRRPAYRENWWLFAEPRPGMRQALAPLSRYIAGNRIGKRLLFAWSHAEVCPSDLTVVFAFDSDYAMGILLSRIHGEWARAQSSTLEDRMRYTPTSAFETFPWPQPAAAQRDAIAKLAAAIVARRAEVCRERGFGLTRLYNEVDDGAYRDLRDLHRELDHAVAAAYGWPAAAAEDAGESNRRLLELNRSIAAGDIEYAPFAAQM